MLATVATLFERLNRSEIRYCHWKSNRMLGESLAGGTDIDVLVDRGDAPSFRAILGELGFRPAIVFGEVPFPSTEHYHAFDEESGAIAHLHAYYRVVSGDSLTKNYRLPIEEMLLENVRREGQVNVPARGAELVVFVLRMSVKHATLPELLLVSRDPASVRREADWLASNDARAEAAALVSTWLPGFGERLFDEAFEAVCAPASLWRRVVVGRRVRARLRPFARRGRIRAWLAGVLAFLGRATYRLRGSRKALAPVAGGAVVAFVGVEAAGKSTMIEDVERWLGRHFTVRSIHAGKPPSTLLTAVPNLLLPAMRRLLPEQRSTKVSAQRAHAEPSQVTTRTFPLLFGLRSVLLAYDRRALLRRAYASSANGAIVLCDRYPSGPVGAPDGPQLGGADGTPALPRSKRWLRGLEARLYRDIPPPDVVLYLTAPFEVTLERNRARAKVEPEDYLRSRHARSSSLEFGRVAVRRIDTNRSLEELTLDVRRAVWEVL